jgi:hypothetical protein
MLLEPVKSSMAQIRSTLPDSLEPELLALLKLVLFKYSIWDRGASYGAMLQNLRYRNEWAHRGGCEYTARKKVTTAGGGKSLNRFSLCISFPQYNRPFSQRPCPKCSLSFTLFSPLVFPTLTNASIVG